MKKIKLLILGIMMVAMSFIAIITGIFEGVKVEAAGAVGSGKLNVYFTVVDYEKYNEYLTASDDFKNNIISELIQYDAIAGVVSGYDRRGNPIYRKPTEDEVWDNPEWLKDNTYFDVTMLNGDWDDYYASSWTTYGTTAYDVLVSIKSLKDQAEKTTFAQSSLTDTSYFGLVISVQSDTNVVMFQVGASLSTLKGTDASAGYLTSANKINQVDYTILNKIADNNGPANPTIGDEDNIIKVGGTTTNGAGGYDLSTKTDLAVIKYPITNNANGTYTITLSSVSAVFGKFLNGSTFYSSSSNFGCQSANVKIEGASNDTTTTFTSGTSAASATTAAKSADHDTHRVVMDTAPASASTIYLAGVVAASGKMPTTVLVAESEAELGTGTPVNETSTGVYAISMTCATNSSMWVSVTVTASDNSSQDTYIVQIPRGKYDVAELTGLSMSVGGSAISLYNSGNSATTTFNSSTKAYYIRLKSDEKSISITPTWDTTKNQTCKVLTSTNTSGATHSTSGNAVVYTHNDATKITIQMKSEDGSKTVNYEISVYRYSDDVSVSLFTYGSSAGSLTAATLTAGTTDKYEGKVALGTTNAYFKFAATSAKATLKYSFEDTTTPGTPANYTANTAQVCAFTNGTGGATMYIHVYVTSESGLNSAEYILTIVRDAGSSDTDILGIKVNYNGSTTADTAVKQPDGSYKISTAYKFNNLTGDYFTFTVMQKSAEVGKQTITYLDSASPAGTPTSNYGTVSGQIHFSQYTEEVKTIQIYVQAQDSSVTAVQYNLVVTRAEASDDVSLSSVVVTYKGTSYTLTADASGNYAKSGLAFGAYAGDSFQLKVTQKEAGQTFTYVSDDKNTASGVLTSGNNATFVFNDDYLSQTVVVTLTVKAVNTTTTKDYTITVTRDGASKETGISKIEIGYNGTAQTPVQNANTYSVSNMAFKHVTNDYMTVKITLKEAGQTMSYTADDAATSSLASVTSGQVITLKFSSYLVEKITATFTVTAPDHDATKDYVVEVTRDAASTNSTLDSSTFKVYKVDDKATKTQLSGSFDATNAYMMTTSTLAYAEYPGGNKLVNAGVGFDVKIPAYSKLTITSDQGHTDTLDNSTSSSASAVTYKGLFAFPVKTQVTVNYTLKVTAQDTSSTDYYVSVTRQAANDDISGITVEAYSTDGLYSYVIKNPTSVLNSQLFYQETVQALPYAVKEVNIVVKSTVSTTKIYYSGNDITNLTTENYAIPDNMVKTSEINNQSFEFKVYTEADDSTTTPRTLKVIYSRVKANTENSINLSNIVLKDDLGNLYPISAATNTPGSKTYTFSLDSRKGMTEYFITGVENSTTTSLATIYAKDNDATGYKDSAYLYDPDTAHTIGTGNTTYIIILSESESPNQYAFNVGFQEILDDNAKMAKIEIAELTAADYEWTTALAEAANGTEKVININIPYSIKGLTIVPTLESTKATLEKDERTAALSIKPGEWTYKFQAKAQDGTLGALYTFKVTKEDGNAENLLTKLTIGSTTVINGTAVLPSGYTQDSTAIHHLVAPTTANIRLAYEVSTNAKVDIRLLGDSTGSDSTTTFNTNLVTGAKNEIVMRITSEKDYYDGKTSSYSEYHIYIYPASDALEVDEIVAYFDNSLAEILKDSDGNEIRYDLDGAELQTFNIPYTTKQAYIDVALPMNLVGVMEVTNTPKGTISSAGITYTIVAKSQYATLNSAGLGQTKTYRIKLIQDAPSLENRLEELHVKALVNGSVVDLIQDFDPDDSDYACERIDSSVTQVTVEYKLMSPNHSRIATASDVGVISVNLENNSRTLKVTVLNEKDQENTYTIILTSGEINWATNANISDIKALVDSKNIIEPFEATKSKYTATVRSVTTEVVFHVATVAPTSTVTVNGDAMVSTPSNTLNTYTADITRGTKNTFKFICTAQDGTTQSIEYTVEITSVEADKTKTLKIFNVNGVDVKSGDVINVKEAIDSVAVKAQATSSYAKLTPQASDTTDLSKIDTTMDMAYGENIISITCTAENGDYETYTVKVIRDYPVELDDIVIYKNTDTAHTELLDVEQGNVLDSYTINPLPYEYGDLVLVIEATAKSGNNVTITGDGEWTIDETGKVFTRQIVVAAASGYSKTYEVSVSRLEGNKDNKITSYKINEAASGDVDGFSPNKNTITYWVERTVEYFEPYIEVSETALVLDESTSRKYAIYNSNGVELKSDNPKLDPGKNVFTIKVYSETHEENAYTVTVYKAENEVGFDNIMVLTGADGSTVINTKTSSPYKFSNFTPENGKYVNNISVNNKQTQIYLKFAVQGDYTKVYVNGTEFTKEVEEGQTVYQGFVKLNKVGEGNANVITMYTLSELGSYTTEFTGVKSDEYVLSVEREEVNGDAKLKTLEVMIEGVNQIDDFDPDEPEYLINNVGAVSQITINAVANSTSATVSGTGVRQLSDPTVNFYSFTVTCTAESGETNDYIVKISRIEMDEDEANSDNTVSFEVIDNNNNNVMTPTFVATTTEYTVTIPYTAQSYIIRLSTKVGSKAKTYLDGAVVDGMKQFTAGSRTNTTHKIYAKSALNKNGTEYTINVIFEQPSSDITLKSLKVVISSTITSRSNKTFNITLEDNKFQYKLDKQPFEYDQATLTAVANDAKTTLTGNGVYELESGEDNQLTITARAEDGTTKTYTITVSRAAEAPYLTDLRVVGNVLKDPVTSSEMDFDQYTYSYLVDVENGDKDSTTIPATIKVQVDNRAYTVNSDNAVRSVSGYVTTFQVNLSVGTNTFNITVQSPEDPENNTIYVLKVVRKAPQSADASIAMLKVVRTNGTITETLRPNTIYSDNEVLEFTAGNEMTEVIVTPTLSSTTSTYKIINQKLNVGENTVVILVTAEDGTKNYTSIKVTREPYSFDVKVNEIAEFSQDYANNTYSTKTYSVKSNITKLTFEITHTERSNTTPIDYVVIGGNQLSFGENTVILQIICGGEIYPVEFKVVRETYEYEVTVDEISSFDNSKLTGGKYTVDSDVSKLTVKVADKNDASHKPVFTTTVNGKGEDLKAGTTNDVVVRIIGEGGAQDINYEFKVTRREYEFRISIAEINDFNPDNELAKYRVPSNVSTLTVSATDVNDPDNKPTCEIVSGYPLQIGTNRVTLRVTGADGYTVTDYEFNVTRRPYEYDLTIKEISKFKDDYEAGDVKDSYRVSADVTSLTATAYDKNAEKNAQVTFLSGNPLKVGTNDVVMQVLAEDGFTVEKIEFTVVREDYEYNISSEQIADLEDDYNSGTSSKKTYTVPSNVTSVDFDITDASDAKVNYKVVSGGTLKPGENNEVEIQITAADGSTTNEKITVYREEMSFEVLENNGVDTNYTCTPKANANDVYVIDLGKDGKASDITEYSKYIKAAADNDLVIEKLTDTSRADCNEVYLRVSTADGSESKIVKLELTSEKSPVTSFDLYVWIALGLAIILLIIILICVNRDKYGSVSRKRKNN